MGCYQLRSLTAKIASLSISIFLLGNFSCRNQGRNASKVHPNSPPAISSINILPEKPTKESELSILIQSHDPNGDLVTFQYQWIRNEEKIIGEYNNILKIGNFKKGDVIQARAIPSDGKINGPSFLSAPLKILNSPPMIQEVLIEPNVAYATDDLKTTVKCSDPDGDFVYYTYQWEKNGVVLPEEKGEVLEKGRFNKGDLITVTVIPDDREGLGKPKKSNPIKILNHPPIIVSSPPISTEGTKYFYEIKTNDPDDDPLHFNLKKGPKSMEIDKNTGLIQWEICNKDKGSHTVEIEVSDDSGAKSIQHYTLAIDFK